MRRQLFDSNISRKIKDNASSMLLQLSDTFHNRFNKSRNLTIHPELSHISIKSVGVDLIPLRDILVGQHFDGTILSRIVQGPAIKHDQQVPIISQGRD